MDVPMTAKIMAIEEESQDIFTWRLSFTDPQVQAAYRFLPGQFNMLSVPGVGEVPISIVSDPAESGFLDHTIRVVGRVTQAMQALPIGAKVGVRGPFGQGWPLHLARGQDVLLVTGGLGCAPLVTVIRYLMARRDEFGRIDILQGVKHSQDLIWREQYQAWAQSPNTGVALAADVSDKHWPGAEGPVTVLLDQAQVDWDACVSMICGPEIMMRAVARELIARGQTADNIWVSLERNMQCATGHCGHCQLGPWFVCKDGPVFPWPQVAELLEVPGR